MHELKISIVIFTTVVEFCFSTPDAKYLYQLTYDEDDPENIDFRDIICEDPWNYEDGGSEKSHCRRAICECDRGLAHRLSIAQDEWDPQYHKNQGGFNKNEYCLGTGGPKKDQCCGEYENYGKRFPYASQNNKACCGSKTYRWVVCCM